LFGLLLLLKAHISIMFVGFKNTLTHISG
jgi:hypothetical protein